VIIFLEKPLKTTMPEGCKIMREDQREGRAKKYCGISVARSNLA